MMVNDISHLSEGMRGAHHGSMAQRGIGYLTRRKRTQLICNIDVNAFAAVMFVLLFIVMAPVSSVVCFPRPSTDLAQVTNAVPVRGASREDAIIIAVQRDGTIFFGGDRVVCDVLPSKIEERVKSGSERAVYIRADPRTKYGNVKEVLENVRASGLERVVFLVESRRED